MSIKNLNVIIALFTVGSLVGCSDFLDADNKASLEAGTYYNNDKSIEELRVNLYSSMKSLGTNIDLQEWGTDLYALTSMNQPPLLHSYLITPEEPVVANYYQDAYSMIKQANGMLKYGSNNPLYVAEAKFVRCYGYYLLTQHFGSVPYITEYIESANKDYPRTPLKDIYNSVIAELEEIATEPQLPVEDTTHKGYISQRAVKTLLSKVCLAAGWDLETKLIDSAKGTYSIAGHDYFDKSAKYAEEAINGQQLTMSFDDKWSPFHEGNEEEIFSLQYERNGYPGDVLTGGHNLQNNYGSQLGSPMDNGLKASSGTLVPSAKAIYLWGPGDERYDGTFMTTIYNGMGTWGTTGYYAYYNATDAQKAENVIAGRFYPWYATKAEAEKFISDHQSQFVKGACKAECYVEILADPTITYKFKANGQVSTVMSKPYNEHLKAEGMTTVTSCVKKFDDPTTPQDNSATGYRDVVLFHLSDLYLVAAEAYLMVGNEAKALDYINKVRARAKTSAIKSFVDYHPDYEVSEEFDIRPVDLLLDERARELYAERTRWMDLRRTKQLIRYNLQFNQYINSISDMSNNKGEVKWYRPIPAAEIETNTAISNDDQNPGY